MVPSRGHPVKRERGVIVDPKVRLAILSLFSLVMPREQHCDHRGHSTARGPTLSQWRWHLQDFSQNIVLTWFPFPWPVPFSGSLMLKGKLGLLMPSGDPGPMGPPGRQGHRGPKGEKGEKGRNTCHPQESRVSLSGSGTSPSLTAGKHSPSFLFVLDLLSFFMNFSINPPFDFSYPQVNSCMLAEEKEEVLVFKERGSSVLHRAAVPAACRELAWVFTALMLKHPHCSADPLELIVRPECLLCVSSMALAWVLFLFLVFGFMPLSSQADVLGLTRASCLT